MKSCTKCNKILPLTRFALRSDTKKPRSRCRECTNEDNLKRYHNSEKTKAAHKNASYRHRIKSYGLTLDQYDEMYESQDGNCKICSEKPDRNLVIDHCHKTGVIRGLLCNSCNVALGAAKDDPEILSKMISYLETNIVRSSV